MKAPNWWVLAFPPPSCDEEEQLRAMAIGALIGLVIAVLAIAGCVGLLLLR